MPVEARLCHDDSDLPRHGAEYRNGWAGKIEPARRVPV
jgi:hypothetical protein